MDYFNIFTLSTGCNSDLKDYLNGQDPNGDNIIGTPPATTDDTGTPTGSPSGTPPGTDDTGPTIDTTDSDSTGPDDSDTYVTPDCPDGSDFLTEYYADKDGDGYYSLYDASVDGFVSNICAGTEGYLTTDIQFPEDEIDINDNDSTVNILRDYYLDVDSDGYGDENDGGVQDYSAPAGYVDNNEDRDDADATVFPGATELCDDKDNDQDDVVDEGFTYTARTTLYPDADSDGYGDAAGFTQEDCDPVAGYTTDATDCDDTTASVSPAATETCNGVDDECDGQIDEAVTTTFYADADGDNFGDASRSVQACSAAEAATLLSVTTAVTDNTDWNDTNATLNPGATLYIDADGDGFGDTNDAGQNFPSDPGSGYVTNNTDFDDAHATAYPGATEICDQIDNTGEGDIDEGVTTTFYADADGDGYGNAGVTTQDCSAPMGYVSNADDCDDTNAAINPAASEVCNELDDDCDTAVDTDDDSIAAGEAEFWLIDYDNDGFADLYAYTDYLNGVTSDVLKEQCDNPDPTGATNWIAFSTIDGVDVNGDGTFDQDDFDAFDDSTDVRPNNVFYLDSDGDGDGDANSPTMSNYMPTGYSENADDCDDTNADVFSGASEKFDFRVNDCSSTNINEDAVDLGGNAHDVIEGSTNLGADVSWIGDVNSDGVPDLTLGDASYSSGGGVFLLSGANFGSGGTFDVTTDSLATITSSVLNAELALSDPLDDFDNDGIPDFVVRSGYSSAYTGIVLLLSGTTRGSVTSTAATVTISGSSTDQYLGYTFDSGNLNGNSAPDVVLSQPGDTSNRGSIHTFNDLSSGSFTPSASDVSITGQSGSDFFGSALAVGDFDNDGNDDLIVAAFGFNGAAENTGKLYLIPNDNLASGDAVTLSTLTIEGSLSQEEIGRDLRLPDVDGDGRLDFWIGASLADLASGNEAGVAHLFLSTTVGLSGSYTTNDADFSFEGQATQDHAGTLSTGDVDADGFDDLGISAPLADTTNGTDAGEICIYNGALILQSLSHPASYPYDYDAVGIACFLGPSGSQAGYAFDFDNNMGFIAVGAPATSSSTGAAYVVPFGQ